MQAQLWHRECPEAATPALATAPDGLTDRELDVLLAAAGGLTSRAVADHLFVSVRTVDNHLHAIYQKLGLPGRAVLADLIPR